MNYICIISARSSGDRAVVSGTASCGGSNPSERAISNWKNLRLIHNQQPCYSITCNGQAPLSHIIYSPSVGTLGFYFVKRYPSVTKGCLLFVSFLG